LVLWKIQNVNNFICGGDDLSDLDVSHSSDEDERNDEVQCDTLHTLPFKVLGSCYSKERQNTLETACEYMYEYNRPVLAKLVAEPDNIHDSNAIAVYIMYSDYYEKVGYIAREMTQYVHSCLNDPSFRVSVKSIKYRTKFSLLGFYLTLDLTKKGLWYKQVETKSKSIK
jgi:hypothetical protein